MFASRDCTHYCALIVIQMLFSQTFGTRWPRFMCWLGLQPDSTLVTCCQWTATLRFDSATGQQRVTVADPWHRVTCWPVITWETLTKLDRCFPCWQRLKNCKTWAGLCLCACYSLPFIDKHSLLCKSASHVYRSLYEQWLVQWTLAAGLLGCDTDTLACMILLFTLFSQCGKFLQPKYMWCHSMDESC